MLILHPHYCLLRKDKNMKAKLTQILYEILLFKNSWNMNISIITS